MAASQRPGRRPVIPHIAFISLPQNRYPFPAIAPQLTILSERRDATSNHHGVGCCEIESFSGPRDVVTCFYRVKE